jgi:hypothetical protein
MGVTGVTNHIKGNRQTTKTLNASGVKAENKLFGLRSPKITNETKTVKVKIGDNDVEIPIGA